MPLIENGKNFKYIMHNGNKISKIRDGRKITTLVEGYVPPEPPTPGEDDILFLGENGQIIHHITEQTIELRPTTGTPLFIADRDVGAENVGDFGEYFARGNNAPRSTMIYSTREQIDASSHGPSEFYEELRRRGTQYSIFTWDSGNNANLWGGVTDTNSAKKGPCSDGFHIPTEKEWEKLFELYQSIVGSPYFVEKYLKLFCTGYVVYYDANFVDLRGDYGRYRCANQGDNNSGYAVRLSGDSLSMRSTWKATMCCIRPFKDTTSSTNVTEVLFNGENGSIIHDITNGEIVLTYTGNDESITKKTMTIADKNLGASTYRGQGDDSDNSSLGNLIKWGASSMSGDAEEEDWAITQSIPPNGWHIPSINEWGELYNLTRAITGLGNPYGTTYFLLPITFTPGYGQWFTRFWSSTMSYYYTPNPKKIRFMMIESNGECNLNSVHSDSQAIASTEALPVRLFKD